MQKILFKTRRVFYIYIFFSLILFFLTASPCQAQSGTELPKEAISQIEAEANIESTSIGEAPRPPQEVLAEDNPYDDGSRISISWLNSPDFMEGEKDVVKYIIERSETSDGEFQKIGELQVNPLTKRYNFVDSPKSGCSNEKPYFYRVTAVDLTNQEGNSEIFGPVKASKQWFFFLRINTLVGSALFVILLIFLTRHAKKGKDLFIRRIAGLDALEEAIGRATEMGKPILFVPGISSISDVATIAGLNIMSMVAKKACQYNTRLIVPNRDPIVVTVAQEIVKEAYVEMGRPDAYREEDVYYVTFDQFPYVAAVCGIMMREKPATNLLLGMFYAEALVLAETGAASGAIQIAGTDAITQLPFFVTTCDYTLIGEELYAGSAYLSREPVLVGSLKSQDWMKFFIGASILFGTILLTLGIPSVKDFVVKLFTVGSQ